MNRDELLEFHEEFTAKMYDICRRKNQDYAGGAGDPFANFRRVEALGVCATELGFLVRMTDKMSRLATLLQPGAEAQVKDESVEDTLIDLANYSLLLAAFRRAKPKPVSAPEQHPNCRCVIEPIGKAEEEFLTEFIEGGSAMKVTLKLSDEARERMRSFVQGASAADEFSPDLDEHAFAKTEPVYGRCPNRNDDGRCNVCGASDFGTICTYRGA